MTEMNNAQVEWATHVGRLGFAARGIAVRRHRPSLAPSTLLSARASKEWFGALQELAETAAGQWLLGVIAFGPRRLYYPHAVAGSVLSDCYPMSLRLALSARSRLPLGLTARSLRLYSHIPLPNRAAG